jgi:hypothetical protein
MITINVLLLTSSFTKKIYSVGHHPGHCGHGSSRALATRDVCNPSPPLEQFDYGDVVQAGDLHEKQPASANAILMGLSDDSLIEPFREMRGKTAPGEDLGGWYHYDPNYDWHAFEAGFAPAATFGQWVSALARDYAITGDGQTRDKVLRLNRLYAQTISGSFYEKNRFPAYCSDKLLCGLIDSHRYVGDPDAFSVQMLPLTAIDEQQYSTYLLLT